MKQCKNCKHYASFEGVCCNADSEHCADYINSDCCCGEWELNKKGVQNEIN